MSPISKVGLRRLACTAALGTTVFLSAAANSQQVVPQTPSSAATEVAVYFPPGEVDSSTESLFSSYLARFGEPSLLAAAQNPKVLSYRLTYLSSQHGSLLAIRLSLNSDGGGAITSTVQPPMPAVLQRTQLNVSDADGKKFLQMVENSKFWSMPTQENPDPHRRMYKMDASWWVFEGVRNGSYHVVFRRGPETSAFAEMVSFLANDLTEFGESAIPRVSR